MCKVFAITDLSRVSVTTKLLSAIQKAVTKHSDKHGFGYAVMGKDGSLGGERTTRIDTFRPLSGACPELPILARTCNRFGKLNKALKAPAALVAHGRFSTNTVSLENTHPFYNGRHALIHNGVVNDQGGHVGPKLVTDNDTEILLRYWEKGGMADVESHVTGYYALAILDRETRSLHIVRDSRAPLYMAWVTSINSYMVATTPEIIGDVCKAMRWKHNAVEPVLDNVHAEFCGNDIIHHARISPCQAVSSTLNKASELAFGKLDRVPSYREEEARLNDWPEDDFTYLEMLEVERAMEAAGEDVGNERLFNQRMAELRARKAGEESA